MEGARAVCSLQGLALLPARPHQPKPQLLWTSLSPELQAFHTRDGLANHSTVGSVVILSAYPAPDPGNLLLVSMDFPVLDISKKCPPATHDPHVWLLRVMLLKGIHPVVWHCFCGLIALQRMYGYVSSWFFSCIHHLVSIRGSLHL